MFINFILIANIFFQMLTFFEAHPNLEHLGIYYYCHANFSLINFVSNATQQLLRLKSFSYCGDVIPEGNILVVCLNSILINQFTIFGYSLTFVKQK